MRVLLCLSLLAVLVGVGSAQTTLYGPGTTRAFQNGYAGPHTVVRDSQANLYVIYRYQVGSQWDLAIARSSDSGANWNMTWQSGFAKLGSDFGSYHPCIAIDSQDNLHCAWYHRVAYSGSRLPVTIQYNRFTAATSTWGTEWQVNPSAVYERPNAVLAVDSKDYIWFMHGNTGWASVLERSDLPFASDGKFTLFSPSPAAQQHCSMVIDKNDYIHVTYYATSPYAGVHYKWIDPAAATPTWTYFQLSNHGATNHTSRAEYYSRMAADFWGNVYAMYTVDDQAPSSGRQGDTEFYIRKWDGGTQTWGNPVLVHGVPYLVWDPGSAANSGAIVSCACDEGTGELYFAYRDFVTGEFNIGRWRGIDTEPHTVYAKLMNTSPLPVASRNYFLYPHFRGTLWPLANRTAWGLDLTYVVGDQTATSPLYTDYFEHFPVASMDSTGAPKIGTTYPLNLSAVTEGGQAYATALSMSGLMPVLQFDRRFVPIAADSIFYLTLLNVLPTVFINFQGVLSASGTASAGVAIPNAVPLVGLQVDGCFVTYDGTGARAISNPWGFQITN